MKLSQEQFEAVERTIESAVNGGQPRNANGDISPGRGILTVSHYGAVLEFMFATSIARAIETGEAQVVEMPFHED